MVIEDIGTMDPSKNSDWTWLVKEASITIALNSMFAAHKVKGKSVAVTAMPVKYRSVATLRDFEKGALTLVPLTSSIAMKPASDDIGNGYVYMCDWTSVKNKQYRIALSSSGGNKLPKDDVELATGIAAKKEMPDSMLVPFWFVSSPSGDKTANMGLKWETALNGIKVPVLTNLRALKAGDVLYANMSEFKGPRGATRAGASSGCASTKRARK